MNIKQSLAIAAGGAAGWASRTLMHRSGGNIPGAVALRIDPGLVSSLAGLFEQGGAVVVTGTNGKTTTTNLTADCLAGTGLPVVTNRAGNNMEGGIATALMQGRRDLSADARRSGAAVGCFECDELYTVRILPKLRPRYLVLLNLFRDQLDRYGEIDHTQDVIARALEESPATTLLFNADDPLCASIARRVPNPRVAFGIDEPTGTESDKVSDSRFCAVCNAPLDYDYVQYGQLGLYRCPACGWERPALDVAVRSIELNERGYAFDIVERGGCGEERVLPVQTSYRGLYMVYNVCAAFTAARLMGAPEGGFARALDSYRPARGRMQSFRALGRPVLANLAKNPVGFDRMLQLIRNSDGRACAFFVNDNDADGHDISWIWDIDFECLAGLRGLQVFAGGTRANDLQVRLKHAGVPSTVVSGAEDALRSCTLDVDETLYLVGNYTAMPGLCDELDRLDGAPAPAGVPAGGDAGGASPTMGEVADARWSVVEPGTVAAAYAGLEGRPLRITHLYPAEMNLYGDTGNVEILRNRCRWRGIPVEVTELNRGDEADLGGTDIAMIGGGSDRDQLAVQAELLRQAGALRAYIDSDGALLAICGGYQLLGRHYYLGDERIEGIAAIGAETRRAGGPKDRLIGNVSVRAGIVGEPLYGFENHGGRTFLDAGESPLGTSLVEGAGNNGEDDHEGILHRNVVGTYLHGPVLSKNPQLADWLISRALERRGLPGALAPLDDAEEAGARRAFESRLPHSAR